MSLLISIIVPNYNNAKYLPQRLESIFNQTFQNFEVIVLDDHSTDNSLELLSVYTKHPKVSHFSINQTNSGSPFVQWNKGIDLAKGDIIWIAESDDFSDKDFLSALVPKFEIDEKLGLAYCQSHRFSDKNEITGSWLHYTDDLDSQLFLKPFSMSGVGYIKKFLIHKNTIPNASGVLFRKEIFQLIGGADESIRTCSDWLTWLKILMHANMYYESKPLNYFRYHDESVIANAKRSTQQISYFEAQGGFMRLAFHKFLKNLSIANEQSRKILKVNYEYTGKEYSYEGFSQIKKGELRKGLINLMRAAFQNGITFRFLK